MDVSIGKLIRKLIYPYLFFSLLNSVFLWIKSIGEREVSVIEMIKGILLVDGVQTVGPLWFLPTLFFVIIVMTLLNRWIKLVLVKFLILLIINCVFFFSKWEWLPLNPFAVCVGSVFYLSGEVVRNDFYPKLRFSFLSFLVLFFICTGLSLVGTFSLGRIDMNGGSYGNNFVAFFVQAFLGIMTVLLGAKILELSFGEIEIVKFISRNTIIVLCTHGIVGSLIKGLIKFVTQSNWENILTGDLVNSVFSLFVIYISIPVMRLISERFPILIGKKIIKR